MLVKSLTIASVVVVSLVFGTLVVAQNEFPERVISELEAAYKEVISQPNVVNTVALVDAKKGQLRWARASGDANPHANEKMTVDHQFRTASVTKSFTGVLTLQLIESGKFGIDTPVHQLLNGKRFPRGRTVADLHHALKGMALGDQITVRHLLNHTSGLADYWFDDGTVGDWNGRSWLDVSEAESLEQIPKTFDPPTRLWTPEGLVEFFFEVGLNRRAHFPPGQSYMYSDTNYLLLGMIIEDVTGDKLAARYRNHILEPLGITRTYMEYRERPPADAKLAHHFWFLRGHNRDFVKEQLASTGEWANGGQVTTVDDLSKFIRGVFAGKLFRQTETLQLMMSAASIRLDEPQKYFDHGVSTYNLYSCGLMRWDIDSVTVWGHTGFWGIGMFYIPKSDVTIALATNQVDTNAEADMRRFVRALKASGFLD